MSDFRDQGTSEAPVSGVSLQEVPEGGTAANPSERVCTSVQLDPAQPANAAVWLISISREQRL